MKIELSHDSIAKKVFEAASIEDKARTRAEKLIKDRHSYFRTESTLLLTEHELRLIEPYEEEIGLSGEELQYLEKSKLSVKKTRRSLKIKNYLIVGLVCSMIAGAWGFWWRNQALNDQRLASERTIELYRLSDEVRSAKTNEEFHQAQSKAENHIHNLSDKRSQTILQNAGILESAPPVDHLQHQQRADEEEDLPDFVPVNIRGQVRIGKKRTVADAEIELLGTRIQTNENGYFLINLIIAKEALTEDLVIKTHKKGFKTKTIRYSPKNGAKDLLITLQPDQEPSLNEKQQNTKLRLDK